MVNTADPDLIKSRKNLKVIRKEKLTEDMIDQYPKKRRDDLFNNRAPKYTSK
jgi:hypothetical protein